MKEIFKKYSAVIRFIGLFIGSYLILSFLYSQYLKISAGGNYFPDFFTHIVARQSAAILDVFGYNPVLVESARGGGMLLNIKNSYTVNVVEGCNSVSVIILFMAFVISFYQSLKKTFLFLLGGVALIYCVNVFRIAILVVALYKYPEYQEFLHGVLFPAVIYGMVLILWILWIRTIKPQAEA